MAITCYQCSHQTIKFPAGELHVRLLSIPKSDVTVGIDFNKGSDDIIELLLLCNAIKHCRVNVAELIISYLPFGRQDRVAVEGECFSLEVMAELINSIGAKKITLFDPHSDVAPALINNSVVINQCEVFKKYFDGVRDFYLISPDGGALKKVYKLADCIKTIGVIECSKRRNVETGEITGVNVYIDNIGGKDCYIVDDICDGGRTFIEVAKELRRKNCGKIILMVTHGLFTKGIDVIKEHIDVIVTMRGNLTECSDDII